MKKIKISLRNKSKDVKEVLKYRIVAKENNHNSCFGKEVINNLLVSPDGGENYILSRNMLIGSNSKSVPVKNGIPDFTIFSTEALDEKERQANYHNDEKNNERFDEIVLRPFNYNSFHAKIWLKHLYRLCKELEKISGRLFENFTVLNCGCGGGFEAQFFAEQGAKVVGFDISQLRAEASATRFALNDLDGFFYRGDATILPFKDNTFDVVIYHDSLHHVPIEEIPKAIKEARRVAKSYIVLSEAHDSPVRMFLESLGQSISTEASGNYTFRFKKSLIEFWCYRFGMDLQLYKTSLERKEHRPGLYKKPFIGKFLYYFIYLLNKLFSKFGNEALIIMMKTEIVKYSLNKDC